MRWKDTKEEVQFSWENPEEKERFEPWMQENVDVVLEEAAQQNPDLEARQLIQRSPDKVLIFRGSRTPYRIIFRFGMDEEYPVWGEMLDPALTGEASSYPPVTRYLRTA